MNPTDLVNSRRMLVRGLGAHVTASTTTATAVFTPLEARTLSFAPHFFYERWARRERSQVASEQQVTTTKRKRKDKKSQDQEDDKRGGGEPRQVDEFGRDIALRTRKRKRHESVRQSDKTTHKERKKQAKVIEKEEEEEEDEVTTIKEYVQETLAVETACESSERRTAGEDEGFDIETPFGLTALPTTDLRSLLRYGTLELRLRNPPLPDATTG
jgi:hypothetical protein